MVGEGEFAITFNHAFNSEEETAYFAFCFPKSYLEVQQQLDAIVKAYGNGADEDFPAAESKEEGDPASGIYTARELIIRSVEGRRLDLLTVRLQQCCGNRDAAIAESALFLLFVATSDHDSSHPRKACWPPEKKGW